jgi:hypothetical protein
LQTLILGNAGYLVSRIGKDNTAFTPLVFSIVCCSLKLLRTFFSDGLVDSRTLLGWIVQQMGSCNLAQAGFITRLADEYLDGLVSSRALTRPFIDACLCKISEVHIPFRWPVVGV